MSAVQIVVQVARLPGGARKVIKVSEITGMEGETITMHDLFVFKQTGVDGEGMVQGIYQVTGIRPKCLERLAAAGAALPVELFERRSTAGT
jgi:pilus assembly protein CpaF